MIRSQLMSSRNLAAASRGMRVGGVKTSVDIQQSLCPDLSQPGNILAIIIQIYNDTARLLKLMYLKKFWTGIVLVLVLMVTFASIFID